MKQILVQLDDRLAAQLEKIAPGRSHKRSAFVRQALAKAIQQALEARTREAYARWPDESADVDPAAWAPATEALHPEKKRVLTRKKTAADAGRRNGRR